MNESEATIKSSLNKNRTQNTNYVCEVYYNYIYPIASSVHRESTNQITVYPSISKVVNNTIKKAMFVSSSQAFLFSFFVF